MPYLPNCLPHLSKTILSVPWWSFFQSLNCFWVSLHVSPYFVTLRSLSQCWAPLVLVQIKRTLLEKSKYRLLVRDWSPGWEGRRSTLFHGRPQSGHRTLESEQGCISVFADWHFCTVCKLQNHTTQSCSFRLFTWKAAGRMINYKPL